jgi:type IV secretion system protein VirB10
MTDPNTPQQPPPKLDPESLVLKANPRRVVRFKRSLLIAIAGGACLIVGGVTFLALKTHFHPRLGGSNSYDTQHKPTPDALAGLPSNYGQLKSGTPRLGLPLPGDLGPSILEHQRQSMSVTAEQQAAQAERQRLAQQARTAAQASVFFQVTPRAPRAAPTSDVPTVAATPTPPASGTNNGSLHLDLTNDQNNQGRKLSFLNQKDDSGIYNPHALQQPVSPYEVMAGSVIAASLLSGLNSDLPGDVNAWVTENVYDTVTGRILLIPQGSRLKGHYDSVVAFGQSRAFVVWQRIILPNGSSIEIDNLPATDPAGYVGLEDQVDYHTWTLLKGIAMSTLLGVGMQVTFGSGNDDLVEAIRESTQESTNQAGQRIVERNLNIQPTITVRPGWPLRVLISKDLVLTPYRG